MSIERIPYSRARESAASSQLAPRRDDDTTDRKRYPPQGSDTGGAVVRKGKDGDDDETVSEAKQWMLRAGLSERALGAYLANLPAAVICGYFRRFLAKDGSGHWDKQRAAAGWSRWLGQALIAAERERKRNESA